MPTTAHAALPSISEYDAVQYKQRAPDPSTLAQYQGRTFYLGQNVKRDDVEIESLSVAEGLERLSNALERASSLVETRSFEDARLTLRTPLFSDFLGFNPGIRGFQSNPKLAAALYKQLPGAAAAPLEDALVSLKALDDFLLVNRVIYFNEEDKVAIGNLVRGGKGSGTPGQPTKEVELDEPRALLKEVADALREARRLV